MKLAMATCAAYPQLSASNRCLYQSLRARGIEVSVPLWNRDPYDAFLSADLTLLRQTWDYQADPGGFAAWLMRLDHLGAAIEAAPHLALWNNDKRTLSELGGLGVASPKTVALMDIADAVHLPDVPGDRIVLKPAFGGSGVGVHLCERETFRETLDKVRAAAPGRPILAQEFLPEIADGEWKLTCIRGRVALAVHAIPSPGEFRVNARFQPTLAVAEPPEDSVKTAETLLRGLGTPLCARVDGVMRNDRFVCTELELTDPDLHLHLRPNVADALVDAILDRLGRPAV